MQLGALGWLLLLLLLLLLPLLYDSPSSGRPWRGTHIPDMPAVRTRLH